MLLQSGQVTEALRQFQKAFEIIQQLAAADPSDARAQRDLHLMYKELGEVLLQSEKVTETLGQFQKAFEIIQQLAAADPDNAHAKHYLADSHQRLGDTYLLLSDLRKAREHGEQDIRLARELHEADPQDAHHHRHLSGSYDRLGDVLLHSGQVTEALGQFQKAFEIRQQLAAADPSDGRAQYDLYPSYHRIAAVQQRQKKYEQAIETYGRGLNVLLSLKEQKSLQPANEKWIGIVEQSIQECKQAATAMGDWKTLLEQPADVLPVLLDLRLQQFVQDGRAGDAVQAVAKLRELGTATADQLYNAACVYSMCAAGIKATQDELTAEQTAARQQHIADALATLREAIAAGWKDFAHMQKDPDLTVLRDLPEFKALLPRTNPNKP